MQVIEVEHLKFAYDHKTEVLCDLSFAVRQGECIGLIGANGAGKSTLLRLMVGLLSDYQGSLSICQTQVTPKTVKDIRKNVGFVFQDSDSQLFLSTVYEDVAFGPRNQGLTSNEVDCRVQEALEAVNMTTQQDKQIYKLSGGQKKLAAIATVLSMQPEIVLFDEPSVALDPRNRRNLQTVIKRMTCTKLIASHDMEFIKNTCSRVIVLCDGRIVADDETQKILLDEQLLYEYGL